MPDLSQYDPDELQFLMEWAAENGAALQLEGECGFGRECVGITKNGHYPDYEDYGRYLRGEGLDSESPWETRDAWPPAEVHNVYHKHPCLAVLGRGSDRLHELYVWVYNLKQHGIKIVSIPRQNDNVVEAILHGPELHVLTNRL